MSELYGNSLTILPTKTSENPNFEKNFSVKLAQKYQSIN